MKRSRVIACPLLCPCCAPKGQRGTQCLHGASSLQTQSRQIKQVMGLIPIAKVPKMERMHKVFKK